MENKLSFKTIKIKTNSIKILYILIWGSEVIGEERQYLHEHFLKYAGINC